MLFTAQLQETPVVEPINETVEEGATVTFRCSFPEKEDVELHWRRENDDSFGNDTTDIDGVLTITNAQLTDTGKYFCFTENSHGQRIDSTPAELFVNQNKCMLDCIVAFCTLHVVLVECNMCCMCVKIFFTVLHLAYIQKKDYFNNSFVNYFN